MSSIYESNVDPLRPNDAHGISLQLVGRNKTVLELGAAAGHVTKSLKDLGNTVTAVERDGRFLESLRGIADDVHITDLDWLNLRELLGDRTFDVILAGDVLEHCSRPDLVLHQCHDLLAPGGSVVVSLPNIAHGDVRLALLTGRFEYREIGLLDSTHLRFFTRESIVRFADSCGFDVTEIFGSTAPIGSTEFGAPDASIPREAIEYVQADRDHTVYQYVSRLVPRVGMSSPVVPASPERAVDKLLAELARTQEALGALRATGGNSRTKENIARLDSELSVAQQELALVQQELVLVQQELATRKAALDSALDLAQNHEATISEITTRNKSLQIQILAARDHAIGTSAELGELRHRLDIATQEVGSLVHQLNLLHSSRTWRIGRFVLLPLRVVRWVIRQATR